MDIALEMLTMFNENPELLKKGITGDELWVYGYDIEINATKSQDWKKNIKFGQMLSFFSVFSLTAVTCCIMNSCHMVAWSVRWSYAMIAQANR